MLFRVFLLLLTGLLFAGSIPTTESFPAQNGDLIFQVSRSSQSKAIQLATGCRYSHMGIIYQIDRQFYVYEAVQPIVFVNPKNRREKIVKCRSILHYPLRLS